MAFLLEQETSQAVVEGWGQAVREARRCAAQVQVHNQVAVEMEEVRSYYGMRLETIAEGHAD